MGFSEDSSGSSLIFARPPSLSSSLMERTKTKSTLGMVLRGQCIERLLPGGPAFMSGLQKGDKIVSVDGVEAEVSTISSLLSRRGNRPGDVIGIEVARQGGNRVSYHLAWEDSADSEGLSEVYQHIAELARMSKHAGEDAMANTVRKLEEKLDLYVKGRDGKQGSSKSERARMNELLSRIEMEREDERVRMRKEVTEAQRQARDAMAAMEIMQADLNALARAQTSERSDKQGARRSFSALIQALSDELREDPPSPIHHRNILPMNDLTASWKSGDATQAAGNMAEMNQVQADISKIVMENDRCVARYSEEAAAVMERIKELDKELEAVRSGDARQAVLNAFEQKMKSRRSKEAAM